MEMRAGQLIFSHLLWYDATAGRIDGRSGGSIRLCCEQLCDEPRTLLSSAVDQFPELSLPLCLCLSASPALLLCLHHATS